MHEVRSIERSLPSTLQTPHVCATVRAQPPSRRPTQAAASAHWRSITHNTSPAHQPGPQHAHARRARGLPRSPPDLRGRTPPVPRPLGGGGQLAHGVGEHQPHARTVDADAREHVVDAEAGERGECAQLVEVLEVMADQISEGRDVTASLHATQPRGDGAVGPSVGALWRHGARAPRLDGGVADHDRGLECGGALECRGGAPGHVAR
eukprot:scaffold31018_cov63-Phaeocystis_antarctica.AAC.7